MFSCKYKERQNNVFYGHNILLSIILILCTKKRTYKFTLTNPLTSFLFPPHLPLIVTLNPSHRLSQGICSAVLMIRMRSFMLVKYYYSALSRILWIIEKYLGSRHFKSSVLNNRILLPFKPCSQCLLHYRCHLLGIHSFKILITDSLWKLKANTGIAV